MRRVSALSRGAFTLIETLVVIAIVAVMAAILFPVLVRAKEAARSTGDIAAMAQIGHAYALYESDYSA